MIHIDGCATLGFAGFDLETALSRISSMGFRCVELTDLGAYCKHVPYKEADSLQINDLLERTALKPISMNISTSTIVNGEIHRVSLGDSTHITSIRNHLHYYLHIARDLEIPFITYPIGPRVFDDDKWLEVMKPSCEAYKELCRMAAGHGIGLNLEVPHLFLLPDSVEHASMIMEEIDHPTLGATVDTSHWGILHYDATHLFRLLASKLKHIHLRDSRGQDTKDFQQELELTPGRGVVDFTTFARLLNVSEFGGTVSLELEHRHKNMESILNEYQYAIRYLKRHGWSFDESVGVRDATINHE